MTNGGIPDERRGLWLLLAGAALGLGAAAWGLLTNDHRAGGPPAPAEARVNRSLLHAAGDRRPAEGL